MKLRILGCNGGIGKGLRTTSLLVDDDILIDAGSGVGDLTLDEMARIRHIFLTHSHLDHVAFLPLLVDSIFERIEEPIVIHALPETLRGIQEHLFNWVIWPDFANLPTVERPVMRYEALDAGQMYRVGDRIIEPIAVNHIVPTVGFRLESAAGASFAFTGDTTTNDTFWEALNAHAGLDFLLLEVAFANRHEALSQMARHYCSKTLVEDLVKLRHNPAIHLTHHKPDEDRVIFAEVMAAVASHRTIKQLKNNLTFQL